MVLPTINFSGVNKFIYSGQEMSKVYCGSQLVWEKKEREESYREIYTSHLTKEAGPSDRNLMFAKVGQRVIDIDDIVKVVIGERMTIPRNSIGSLYNQEVYQMRLNSSISGLGYNEAFYIFESVEIYLK